MENAISSVARAFAGNFHQMPAMAEHVDEVLRLTSGEAGLREVAQPIERDPALAMRFIRAANSAFYSGVAPSATVTAALGRLGLTEARQLAISAVVMDAFRGLPVGLDAGRFWRHSLATALAAGVAGRLVGGEGDGERLPESPLYTAGLVHHVGILAEAVEDPARFEQALRWSRERACSMAQAEQAVFGFDHAQVGAALLQQWKFPPLVWQAALHHHEPEAAPEPRDGARAVHVASFLCHELKPGGGFEGVAPWLSEAAFYQLGWSQEHLPLLLEQVRTAFEKADQLTLSLAD